MLKIGFLTQGLRENHSARFGPSHVFVFNEQILTKNWSNVDSVTRIADKKIKYWVTDYHKKISIVKVSKNWLLRKV